MQADPLQQLRDVHLPAEPGWWPPAPGWWLVAVVSLMLLVWIGLQLRRHHQQRQPFRTAQRLHAQLCANLAQQQISTEQYLHEANALLKRTFVHALGEQRSAALTGDRWLHFLNEFVEGEPFTSSTGALLTQARFAPAQAHSDGSVTALQAQISAALTKAARS